MSGVRTRIIYFPDGRRVEYDPDRLPPPRPRIAVHGIKPEFYSHADGKYYTDVRTYERELKALGYQIVADRPSPVGRPREYPEDPTLVTDLIETAREYGVSVEGRFPNDTSDPELQPYTEAKVLEQWQS